MSVIKYAMRAHVNTLSVLSVAQNFAATATGYARTVGSFLDDGFLVGDEIVPHGFTDDTPKIIRALSDDGLSVTTFDAPGTVEAASARAFTIGMPVSTAYENRKRTEPVDSQVWWREQYLPQPGKYVTTTAYGDVHEVGIYTAMLYGVPEIGEQATERLAEALKAHFPGDWCVQVATGVLLRTRTELLPSRGQLSFDSQGNPYIMVSIPFRVERSNVS